jgi:pyruvate formate lyase activating enzyme
MNIGGFQPFTLSDFPGRAAAIVFVQGCNFRCPYCHNRQLWPQKLNVANNISESDVLVFLGQRQGCISGLVITGGEPTLQTDLVNFIRAVRRLGVAVKLDTNGSRPEVVEALLDEALIDYIAMDVKAPYTKYDSLCGGAVDKSDIFKSINIIADSNVCHHFRTTFYPALLTEIDLQLVKEMLPPQSGHCIQVYRESR